MELKIFMEQYYDNDETCVDALNDLEDETFLEENGWELVFHEGIGTGVYSPKENVVAVFDEDDLPLYHTFTLYKYNPNAWVKANWDEVYDGENGSSYEVEELY